MEHKQPYCFKCRLFHKDKGKRFPTAHCAFETYVRCIGRLRGEKPDLTTLNVDAVNAQQTVIE